MIPEPRTHSFSVLCWNIGNPSVERAGVQAQWLRARPEDVLVLTETKSSDGCKFLETYFSAFGYHVLYERPQGNEYGVMIVSRQPFKRGPSLPPFDNLQARYASVMVSSYLGPVEVIGLYVPSRDASEAKKARKRTFLQRSAEFLRCAPASKRIVCGDLNLLEPDHFPKYSTFEKWEYAFYEHLGTAGYADAFRTLHRTERAYSWVGRTGDGYRYDHAFVSCDLLPHVGACFYLDDPRHIRLSDHSAIVLQFGHAPALAIPIKKEQGCKTENAKTRQQTLF